MANPEHLAKLKEGVKPWNQWRRQNPKIRPDLRDAELDQLNLSGANLSGANLSEADLCEANLGKASLDAADLGNATLIMARLFAASLREVDLAGADLTGADLGQANLSGANLRGAYLCGANLYMADLSRANLSGADLQRADLQRTDLSAGDLTTADLSMATMVGTNLDGANLTGCFVHGISAWDVRLEGAIQSNLVITPKNKSPIQVDNLEVAQFIYLLLNNEKIRSVIDTITSKVVLILGRFKPERKVVLEAIRDELRKRNYLPVLFDFEKPASKDLTGTISTLANMARFVIADLTDPSSVPHELATLVPGTVVPVQAIILEGQREYAMFRDLKTRYHWVLEPQQYKSQELLIAQLSERVIEPAEAKARELARNTDARY